jgi:hypothetical protein
MANNNGMDVLFYSNYCVYSKQLLTDMSKMNIKSNFVMVCVENYKNSIPRAIDRVPTILTRSGDILVDEDIARYLNSYRSSRQPENHQQSRQQEQMPPEDTFSRTNAGFSYLGDDTQTDGGGGGASYGIFGEDQHIETPDDDNKDDDHTVSYERYKASRDADVNINTQAKLARVPSVPTSR